MARAEVLIEDAEAPLVGAHVRFLFHGTEGAAFHATSPAHQLANILRMKLDEMAAAGELQALGEPVDEGDMSAANADLFERSGEPAAKSE